MQCWFLFPPEVSECLFISVLGKTEHNGGEDKGRGEKGDRGGGETGSTILGSKNLPFMFSVIWIFCI